MTFTGIHHVVIRVKELEEAANHWGQELGLAAPRFGENTALGVKQAFFDLPDGGFVELIAPLNAHSDIARVLDAKGEGVHLISMSVLDSGSTASELKSRGVTILGQEKGPFFVHPKSANGVMLGMAEG
ncbi:MAG: VOC family protein [Pseudomonadota bacterium]